MQHNPQQSGSWSEQEHREFYNRLKNLNVEERSKALIGQAQELRMASVGSDKDLLKAAESMMTFWTLNVRHAPDCEQAHALLCDIYNDLDEPEKARKFGG